MKSTKSQGGTPVTLESYLDTLTKQQESARVANIERKNQILGIFDQIASTFAPGGAMEQRTLANLATQKRRDVGQETQGLISSGLFNTTTAAGLGRRWESQVGTPARMTLEDVMQQRQADVFGQKAGFLERIEEPYPDMGLIAQLVMAASQQPQQTTTQPWKGTAAANVKAL